MANRQEGRIVKDIRKHFGFLFDKGYQIREVCYFPESFGNWFVILDTPKYYIRIDLDRSYISISFDPEKSNGGRQFGLGSLIYYLSNGKRIVGDFEGNPAWGQNNQFERLAGLLKEYHEQITGLFETESQSLQEDLVVSQKKYGELLQERYSQKFAAEEKTRRGLYLLGLFTRFIGIGILAFLGWAVSKVFITAVDTSTKIQSGLVVFAVIIMIILLSIRLGRDLLK